MIYDLSLGIKTYKGEEVKDAQGVVTPVSDFIVNALDTIATSEATTLTGVDRQARFMIGVKIYDKPTEVELTPEDASLCKEVVGKCYGPLVVGRIWAILDKK